MQKKIAGRLLLITGRALRLAVEELAVNIDPGGRAGSHQRLGVNTCAANPVSPEQIRQLERLAQCRREDIAKVGRNALPIHVLIVIERRPSLFEGRVKTLQLDAHAASIEVRLVPQAGWYGKLV